MPQTSSENGEDYKRINSTESAQSLSLILKSVYITISEKILENFSQ